METQHIKEMLQSKKLKKVVAVSGIIVVVLVVFAVGIEVGYMKAEFSYKFGESYYRSFGPEGMHPMGLVPGDVSDAHGVNGKIVSINMPTLIIADRDNTEKVVRIDDDTVIRELRSTINATDLRLGDDIVIIGMPNDASEVEAKFIRVLTSPGIPATTVPQTH